MAVGSESEWKRSYVGFVGRKQDRLGKWAPGDIRLGWDLCKKVTDSVCLNEYKGLQESGGGV